MVDVEMIDRFHADHGKEKSQNTGMHQQVQWMNVTTKGDARTGTLYMPQNKTKIIQGGRCH